jgi:hypothetical protein
MLAGSASAMLLVLNESDLVVGKKSVPSSGTRELVMDLESKVCVFVREREKERERERERERE